MSEAEKPESLSEIAQKKAWTAEEAGRMYGFSERHFERFIAPHIDSIIRIGRLVRYLPEEVHKAILRFQKNYVCSKDIRQLASVK